MHQIMQRAYKIFVILYDPCINCIRSGKEPVRSLLYYMTLASIAADQA